MSNILAVKGGPKAIPEGTCKKWPYITDGDKKAVMRVLDYGLSSADTPEIDALQKEWAEYVGIRHCLATNSGTAALHMCLAACGVGPGDEVIVPAYTFIASGTAVLHNNAIPVFVEIEPNTWNIDPSKIEAAITPYTKAIMPVHLNGYPADMDEINAIAKKYNLFVMEDACQSHGATYKGRKTGVLGDVAAFSLNSWKNLPGGDGGLFVTDDDTFRQRASMLREFGEIIYKGQKREYKSCAMGYMYRTTDLVAAFVRSQLKRLNDMNECRIQNAIFLNNALKKYDFIEFPKYKDDRTCVYWFYPFMFNRIKAGFQHISDAQFRDWVCKALCAEGLRIGAWQNYTLPAQTIFREKIGYGKGSPWSDSNYKGNVQYIPENYPVAQKICDTTAWLANMYFWPQTKDDLAFAISAFDKVFTQLDVVIDHYSTGK